MTWIWIAIAGFLAGFGLRWLADQLYPSRDDKLFKDYLRREYGGKDEPNPRKRGA